MNKDPKDSEYNNKPGEMLKKGEFNPNQLRYELSVAESSNSILAVDYSVSLQAPVSMDEMTLPVRNVHCTGLTNCVWSLDDLFEYLKNNTFVDTDGQTLCYYCINCFKNSTQSNKRYLSKLYLDKELSLYIAQARILYGKIVPQDKAFKLFKKGTIKYNRTGTIEYCYKKRMQNGWENSSTVLKDPRKLAQVSNIKFAKEDFHQNPQNLRTFIRNHSKIVVKKLSTQMHFLEATKVLPREQWEGKINEICNKIATLYKQNISLLDFGSLRGSEFTFGFTSPCHFSQFLQDMNYLVVYYPYYQLWRKFHLKLGKAEFMPIDSAIYLRHQRSIYIIGGARVRYDTVKDANTQQDLTKRSINDNRTCYKLSLEKVEPLRPTKIVKQEMKMKITLKSKLNASTSSESPPPSPPKPKTIDRQIIGEMYPEDLPVEKLADLPESMNTAAGVVHDGYMYVFGGSKYISDSEEELLGSAYRLSLKQPTKWEKLKPLPTPRRSHFAVSYNGRIYIVGGISQAKIAVPNTTRAVDIYNPVNGNYESKMLTQNPFVTTLSNQLFSNRCIACRLNQKEFLMVNGDRNISYVFNAQKLSYRMGGQQIFLTSMASGWKMTNSSDKGPKLQQIFDMHPIKYNGYFYYMHVSLMEEMIRVVYGDGDSWHLTEETDMAEQPK